jgi:hypothetical protein
MTRDHWGVAELTNIDFEMDEAGKINQQHEFPSEVETFLNYCVLSEKGLAKDFYLNK